ncbi:hypothetical protein HMPREF9446_02956 [Bacteroides fluxus YIT 12057]|uniref:Uncharacterized protein n=1 Tax=Bacteroides fluxus YIT 12057 TaxID=763034 RepID=F3PW25_9BACE|nr:hypothetical protein HMPREF9446_02956 [Bacteroides fluxus YIT 12057]
MENKEKEGIQPAFSVIEQKLLLFLPGKAKTSCNEQNETTDYEYYTNSN